MCSFIAVLIATVLIANHSVVLYKKLKPNRFEPIWTMVDVLRPREGTYICTVEVEYEQGKTTRRQYRRDALWWYTYPEADEVSSHIEDFLNKEIRRREWGVKQ